MTMEQNAPVVTLDFGRPTGGLRRGRLLFDSGGGAIILDASLAHDIGLHATGNPTEDDGQTYAPTTVPAALFGTLHVDLSTSKAFIHTGSTSFDTREEVEGMLPGKALERYQVVVDYPKGLFTIATSGCVKHLGVRVPTPFVVASGHPMIEVSIAGRTYKLLLDTGSTVTLARRSLMEELLAEHPDWPHTKGAVGAADVPGSRGQELLLKVPEVSVGTARIRDLIVASRSDSIYPTNNYETPAPIVGALGSNALKNFRVEIDYPNQVTYLEQSQPSRSQELDTVGVVADVNAAGELVVEAVASTAWDITGKNLRRGDVILRVEGIAPVTWTLAAASSALAGIPGEKKRLLLRRNGKTLSVIVTVASIL